MGDPYFLTSPRDLAKWDANLSTGRLGGPELIRQMLEPARLNDGERVPYGLAMHLEPYRGVRRYWHGGLGGGYRSQIMHYPDQGVSVLVMCNLRSAEPVALAERVSAVVLSGAVDPAATPPRGAALPGEIAADTGVYVDRRTLSAAPVSVLDGTLALLIWATRYPLRPLGGGRFRVEGQPLTVAFRRERGRTLLAERWDGRSREEVLPREPAAHLSRADAAAYAGTFRSPDVGVTWRVAPGDDGLRLEGAPGDQRTVHFRGSGLFTDDEGWMLLLFRRGPSGRVTGFSVSTPRARGMAFDRE
jgi:hypothetical protein